MAVPSVITDLNVTAGSNSPAGTDPIGSTLDDYLRAIQSIVRREQAQGASIASAATTSIGGNSDGSYVHITGTTTITSFGTIAAGVSRVVVFDGVLTLTHNPTSLILPGGVNITTAAGDVAQFISEGSGNWRCMGYMRANVSTVSAISLAASVSGNALTIALKMEDGSDPSAASPVSISFRDSTASSGALVKISVVAAASIVISSGSTLGTANSTPFKGWIVAFNDAGTVRLGVVNCLSGKDIYPLSQFGIASSTAEGGLGAADSAQVFYTGTAVSSKSYVVLGYFSYESGLSTAGSYASVPTRLQIFDKGVPLPGQIIGSVRTSTGALVSGSTAIPSDDTIPQNTEGFLVMSKAYTPSSAAHVLDIAVKAETSTPTANVINIIAAFQDSTANAFAAASQNPNGGTTPNMSTTINESIIAGTTSSTTMTVRAGADSATTLNFNGRAGTRLFGGISNSFLQITERAT